MNFICEIRIALFQLLYVEVRIPGTTHCHTSIDFIENVNFALTVGKVDIFYFPFATMYYI